MNTTQATPSHPATPDVVFGKGSVMTTNLEKARQAEAEAKAADKAKAEAMTLPESLTLDALPADVLARFATLTKAVDEADKAKANVADALTKAATAAVDAWRQRAEYVARVGIAASPKAPGRFAAYTAVRDALAPDVPAETFRTWYAAGFLILANPDVSLSSDPARFSQTVGTKDAQAAYRRSLSAAEDHVAAAEAKAKAEAKATIAKATKAAEAGEDIDLPKVEADAAAKATKAIDKAKAKADKVAAKAAREESTKVRQAADAKRKAAADAKDKAKADKAKADKALAAVADVMARGSRNGWEDGALAHLTDGLTLALATLRETAETSAA